ncbi:3-hydroxyacyl-CoA dehydrogenase family protein [Streptomyces anulatus]
MARVMQGRETPREVPGVVKAAAQPTKPQVVALYAAPTSCTRAQGAAVRRSPAAPPLLPRMVDAGLLGRKTGSGFYPYA